MRELASPLLLEPILVERPWGDQRLARVLGRALPAGARIGESWETANEARVAAGPLAGLTLRELAQRYGDALLGRRGLEASQPYGDFPLLVKFIDADDVLSVQVHPDDAQAASRGQRGKTEAWYVLAAEPGAELIVGLREPLDTAAVRRLLAEGRLAGALERLAVSPGDTVLVPAGTLHAIGRGVLLYEIQEQSDLTYRFYDWDRVDERGQRRPLHVEEGLAVLRPAQRARRVRPLALDDWRAVTVACRYFWVERWEVGEPRQLRVLAGETVRIASCVGGAVRLAFDGGPAVSLAAGQTALVPAQASTLVVEGRGTLLVAGVPDLPQDVVEPLRAAGYDHATIAQLGGDTPDLARLLDARTVRPSR